MTLGAGEYNQTVRKLKRDRHGRLGHAHDRLTAVQDATIRPAGVFHAWITSDLPSYCTFGVGGNMKPRPMLPTYRAAGPKNSMFLLATNGSTETRRDTWVELRTMTGLDPFLARCIPGTVPGVGEMCGPSLDDVLIRKNGCGFFVAVGKVDPTDDPDLVWVVHATRFQGMVCSVRVGAPKRVGQILGEGQVEILMRDEIVAPNAVVPCELPERVQRLPFYNHTEHDIEGGDIIRVKATVGIGLTVENPCGCL